MSALADQIAFLEREAEPRPGGSVNPLFADAIRSLKFMQQWEPEIRASHPIWKAARASIRPILEAFPNSTMAITDASE